jgi:hypothetical protein
MLKFKLSSYLAKVGEKGAKRTYLMQRFACRADELDRAVVALLAEGAIVAWVTPGRGRPATAYYNKKAVAHLTPPDDLTVQSDRDIPISPEPGEPSTRTTSCKTCGKAIPMPAVGRPFVFCSRACKSGGYTMRAFLSRAVEPRAFAEVSICLVMADLIMRGYDIARHVFVSGPRILVTDNEVARYIDVVPIGLNGHFPNPQEFEMMAGVYRDGRIVYAGRNCFIEGAGVDLPVAPDDGEPVVDEDEPLVENEEFSSDVTDHEAFLDKLRED